MSERSRLAQLREQIAEMLADGSQIRNFYRFVAQNPHIPLHDACQIVVARPDASVCFTYEEWNAMGRRITRGRKGIAVYDWEGNKDFVFDAIDTHGEERYQRLLLPMKRLLQGFDELNGSNLADDGRSDYRKIHRGVQTYLRKNGYFTGDSDHDGIMVEGIAYSLYSKTGFPKDKGIKLHGLPYSVHENAELFKEVYFTTDIMVQEIEDAYLRKKQTVEVVDDTEEETVSDEPIVEAEPERIIPVSVESPSVLQVEAEPAPKVLPFYQTYINAQKEKPNAVVVMRYGDFYEVMGEKARMVADELDLTLTGRNVGLDERVPMCGFPYHVADKYIEKLLQKQGVVVIENDNVPRYILSHDEARNSATQNGGIINEHTMSEGEPPQTHVFDATSEDESVFDGEEDEDWKALYEGSHEVTDEAPEEFDEDDVPDASEWEDDPEDLRDQEEPEPEAKVKSTPKKSEKGIKDRKRKGQKPMSLFDLLEPQEKSREEQMIERQLKRGSGFQNGKFRIFDKYNENPSGKAFADFLRHEYGIGGFGMYGGDEQMHDGKGIKMSLRGEKGEVLEEKLLKWPEVAERIADLIDDDNYLTEKDKKEYIEYKVEQNRLREQRAEEERRKNEFINKVIVAANPERKQRILDEYASTTQLTTFSEFLKEEYGTSEEQCNGFFAIYNAQGIWLREGEKSYDIQNRIYLNWNEFADKVCSLIENDRYIEPFNSFKELTRWDREFFDDYQQRSVREPTNSMWDEVQSCITIANGIYEVSTEGHGGVMIAVELAPHVLSSEALEKGILDGGYYCYEEDADAAIPLRELYDKGILTQEHDYFTQYHRARSENPSIGFIPFSEATEAEKATFFKEWNEYINRSLGTWNPAYWAAHEQAERKAPELTSEEQKINDIVDRIVKEGTENTSEGNWIIYFDEFGDDEDFAREHQDKIAIALEAREEVSDVILTPDGFDTNYYLDFCPNYEWKDGERDDEESNTDLSAVGFDQSELGGAKTRFKNNVAAIKLVNRLYAENRNPTSEEKKGLAQYVGWGGLAQAFDEKNAEWAKEYAELKALLSVEDYEQAKGSTLNAHYTSKEVIDSIYHALDRFGVKGNNRILEPAMGTGNFFGYMPQGIAEGAKLYGVELDNITGRIATKLYPQANVQIKGFEETTFPNDRFDVVVGNVPFGGYTVFDSDYNRHNFYIHDYFLAKSIDKLCPNGVMAVITSKGTMDKLNPSVRKYLADRAELLGAVRLPNTAFRRTAGTEVVTDILFFRKREERINADTENTEWISTCKTAEGYEINSYFINHPDMVLGTLAKETGLYGAEDITVKSDGRSLPEALNDAIERLPANFYENPEPVDEAEQTAGEVDYDVKPFCFKADRGKIYMRVGEEMVLQTLPKSPKDAYERIKGMITLRDELHHILDLQIQGCSDEVLERAQRALNTEYDGFVRRFGNVNSSTNVRLFKEDGDSALLFACESVDEKTGAITKADIFSKRTIRPYTVVTATDDCFEALQISKNERGRVDISYIEELTRKDFDTVIGELGDAIYRDPDQVNPEDRYSGFVTSEEYLSGDILDKLDAAKRYVSEHPEFERNIKALEEVKPEPITAADISVRLGASWVDKEYYKQFYCELLKVPFYCRRDGVELFYNPFDSSWRLDQWDNVRYATAVQQKEVYGTSRAPAYRLFEDCLNLRDTSIYDTIEVDGKEKRVLNQQETIAAREKQMKIREAFKEWIFADPERRDDLERTYNLRYNRTRQPTYDGSYLKFPEMNPTIELNQHQKDVIHRGISTGEVLMHHVVGAGKTFSMIATGMKLRQYGLCKKPMYVVPNGIIGQFASQCQTLFPNARILVATKEDLEKENRRKFVSKVALGDWDGIIITQSSFAKIPVSRERQIDKLNEELTAIEQTIEAQREEGGLARGSVKDLARIKKSKEAALKKLMDDTKQDGVLTFEQLGVDYLFVDEADCYKNLFLFTKMNNVAGISTAASKRASDLKLKCEYIQEMHGGDKGVVFATGTPISNSMTEMYTMQTYLQPSVLKRLGITFFDRWAADFGETVTALEMTPSGQGYRAKTRFKKFTNLPELLRLYHSFADVKTADMIKLPVPTAKRQTVLLKPSDTVLELAEEIAKRAERIYGGSVDPHIDNMLKVTSDGKKLALDPRCFEPAAKDEEGSKLNECAKRLYEIWSDTVETRGTQLVFCDLSTPKKKFEDYEYGKDFDAYNDLKYKLVQRGIPEEEIAFIHDANSDTQRQALYDKVNNGTVRILIGSTEKCGAGTNVQKRLVALHHLDAPYRPRDLEQREGRIIRQGNMNSEVQIYTYVTERTFDSYSYQILENKQRFISQINRGELTVREAEDIDEKTLSYAEIKAITAANPKIKQKMEVDAEVQRLQMLEGHYRKNLYSLQDKVRKHYPEEIHRQELFIERLKEDTAQVRAKYDPDNFSVSVNGKVYTDRKEGGSALMGALLSSTPQTVVGEFCGFKISIEPMPLLGVERSIMLKGAGQYEMQIGQSASGLLTRLDNFMKDFPTREEGATARLEKLKKDLVLTREQAEKPFEHQEKLAELLSLQAQLNAELNLDKQEIGAVIDDGEENDNEEFDRALPTQHRSSAGRPRKRLNTERLDPYLKARKKEGDAHIFVKNGDGYDLIGEQAEKLAADKNLPLLSEKVGGETYPVVHIDPYELDGYIQEIIEKEGKASVIEPIYQKQEVELISEEDTIAQMEVPILPDYTMSQEDMNAYGYNWNGMLPITNRAAKVLGGFGCEIYALFPNGTDVVTKYYSADITDYIYGIEKPMWLAALEKKEVKEYLASRLFFYIAATNVVGKTMDDGQELFPDQLMESLIYERDAIAQYLGAERDVYKTKAHVPTLIEEFSERMDSEVLRGNGWDRYELMTAITNHLPQPLREESRKYIENKRFNEVLDKGLSEIKWLNGRTTGFAEKEIGKVIDDLKPYYESSRYAPKEMAYDDFYPLFCNRDLEPQLRARLAVAEVVERETPESIFEGDFIETTEQGFSIVAIFDDGKRRHAIVCRDRHGDKGDYLVACGYDQKTGQWAWGEYDFTTYEAAELYVKEEYPTAKKMPTKTETPDYIQAVIDSVEKEYAAYRDNMTNKSPDEVFGYNYEIHTYTELHNVICDYDYLTDKDYRALYEDRGHLLDLLYDDFKSVNGASVNTYSEAADFIHDYCEEHHPEIMNQPLQFEKEGAYYFGKDDGTGFYYLPALNRDSLAEIKTRSLDYIIAAQVRAVPNEWLKDHNITFLKVDRDIFEWELKDAANVFDNMRKARGEAQEKNKLLEIGGGTEEEKVLAIMQNYCDETERIYGGFTDRVDVSLVAENTNLPPERVKDIVEGNGGKVEDGVVHISDALRGAMYNISQKPNYSEFVSEIRESYAARLRVEDDKRRRGTPIYLQSGSYARSHGEMDVFRSSHKESAECRMDIDESIKSHFDGMHLDTSFVDGLIEKHGLDRIAYICASTLVEHDFDGRYSRDNKEWAKTIPTSESDDERRVVSITSHPAIVNGFINTIRQKIEEKERNQEESNMPEQAQEQPKREWLSINISKSALIERYENHSFMRLPTNIPEYGGYTYNLSNGSMKDGTMLVDMQSDSRETCFTVNMPADREITLKKGKDIEVKITGAQFATLVHDVSSENYGARQSGETQPEDKQWFSISVPREALRGKYDNATLFALPNSTEYKGMSFYVPTTFVGEDKDSEGERLIINIPEDLTITTREREKNEAGEYEVVGTKELSAYELHKLMDKTTASDYVRQQTASADAAEAQEKNDDGWLHVSVPKEARLSEYEERSMMRMPQGGEHEGYIFYLSNNLLRENGEKGTIAVSLPKDYEINLKKGGETMKITPEQYINEVKGKTAEHYGTSVKKPSEEHDDLRAMANNTVKKTPAPPKKPINTGGSSK